MARVLIRNDAARTCRRPGCGQVHTYLTDCRTHLPIAIDQADTRRLATLSRYGVQRAIPKVGGQPIATVAWPPSLRII